jgi:putative transposase
MIIQKAYKFKFTPTKAQAEQLAIEFGCARFVWNHALNLRQYVYANCLDENGKGETMNYVGMGKHLTFLKNTGNFGWLKDATAAVLTQKLIDLDTAYTNFFKGHAKFPKFKKKGHAESIRFQMDQRKILSTYSAGDFIKLPKLGYVSVRWSQIPAGTPKMVTVSKTATGKYFVSFMCEVEQLPMPKTGRAVGCDVGIKDVIVTSDGFHSGAPKFTYQYQRELRREQRKLSKKTKGSNRWKKQRLVVAKVHEKIANSRKDFLHKLTTKIVSEYDVIFLEDLNVSGMLKNRKLSKAVADVGIFELNWQIKYKAAWYGKETRVIDRWFPSTKTCSSCGNIKVMKLSDRVYKCDCGLVLDRDENAALNIKNEGFRLITA